MNIDGLIACLEFNLELQNLRKIGLSEEEIEGFFDFNWCSDKDIINSLLELVKDDDN